MTKMIFVLTLIYGFLAGCGKLSSSLFNNEIEREWEEVKCMPSEELGLMGSSKKGSVRIYGDKNLQRVDTYYASADCSGITSVVTYDGTHQKNQITDNSGAIDFTYRTVVVTPKSQAAADVLNQNRWCGRTDWYPNVDGVVTDATRDASCIHPLMPLQVADVYVVENGKQMYLGTGDGKTRSLSRPTTPDRARPYQCPCK